MNEKRIAWAITGAGHTLDECATVLAGHKNLDIFLSRAGEEVLLMYGLYSRISVPGVRVYREDKASAPLVGRLSGGTYQVFVVAPATSNSVAKFVHGISDTLVTNMFAQAGKSRVPIIIYPTDLAPEVHSKGPHEESVIVYPRPIDLENTEKLRRFAGVTVVGTHGELEQCLSAFL